MAKLELRFQGDFDGVLDACHNGLLDAVSCTYEDGSDYESGGVRCAVRVFERYSVLGGNRVSLNLTLVGQGSDLFLTAIASGGSQAMFFKVNTIGEENFLNSLKEILRTLPVSRY